ncbi:hypothetical protein VOLCADRAFT_105144 [Volvox carteri f. nagariensis]|uniref:Uncharacterized protein n=1 Tax=Volvox carteri f. nagariensis TaxID=3068 RepID=D8TYM6_VOLCA|nr:uncharacterized protein VOLCADRAFT_105144 [Volvox carteri f. nagariensis]EFJ47420.1 hypothetical protein VOLCADRAFT_105144 [Volvox carteri f. nagariensis]|eukprot:XP_002951609.1 hypothetical protein VOLCADRAFT_105144 [Volvox carteri f. nagariensis]
MSLLTAGGGGGGGGRDRGAHVPLQLRTLAAGLLAAWLANPVNKEVVLQALLPPPSQPPALAPLATPTIITATATTATTATTTSTAPTVAMATTSASSLAAAASASGLGSGCGERAPLDALQELLTLSPAAAAEEVRREAAAAATTTIGEGPVRMVSGALPAGVLGAAEAAVGKDGEENGGNGSGSGACQRLELLQAQRRSDAVAAAVEVLYALACGCGPMGRRLLGAHPGIQSGLAALATGHSVAAADDTLRGCTEREREAAAAAGVGPLSAALSRKPYVYERDLLVARCRATLSAASEVATEVLAALASEETHMANVNDDGDEAQQQRLKEATAEDPHDMREERPSSRS